MKLWAMRSQRVNKQERVNIHDCWDQEKKVNKKEKKNFKKNLFAEKEWRMQERASWPLKCITLLLLKTIATMYRNSHIIITSRSSTYKKSMSKGHSQGHRSWNKKACRRKSMSNHWRAPTWNMKEMQACRFAQKALFTLTTKPSHYTVASHKHYSSANPWSLGFSKHLEFCDPNFETHDE